MLRGVESWLIGLAREDLDEFPLEAFFVEEILVQEPV
jgi:hypothetical protein